MFKVVNIENKKIPMMSNGSTLRAYRRFFQRDFINDVMKLYKYQKEDQFENMDFEIFNDLAWSLAKTANNNIPDIDEWLSQFDNPMSIFEKSEEIIGLVFKTTKTSVEHLSKNNHSKKKSQKYMNHHTKKY